MKQGLLPIAAVCFLSLPIFSCNDQQKEKINSPETITASTKTVDTVALKKELESIASTIDGKVGVAILDLQTGVQVTLNETGHFPMQSIFKFPLAVAVFNQVDKGRISLDQKIPFTEDILLKGTHSPLRDKYEGKKVAINVQEILSATVSQSDNNGCDILFNLIGGTKNVHQYIQSLGIKDMNIVATEAQMHKAWDVQFDNWCTPLAMNDLLKKLYKDNILSPKSHDTLWKMMTETSTGPKRLKGLLPQGTVVAHKTGTSGTNNGITAAINDAGIIMLPNGKAIAVTVYVSDSKAGTERMEEVIAKVGKLVWESFE